MFDTDPTDPSKWMVMPSVLRDSSDSILQSVNWNFGMMPQIQMEITTWIIRMEIKLTHGRI